MKKTTLLTCLALTGVLGLSSTAYASEVSVQSLIDGSSQTEAENQPEAENEQTETETPSTENTDDTNTVSVQTENTEASGTAAQKSGETSSDGQVVPGTNMYDAGVIPFNTKISGTATEGVYNWYAFTTGPAAGTEYKITCVNTTPGADSIHYSLYDEYGSLITFNGFTALEACSDGVPSTMATNELDPNTTYYLQLITYDADPVDYILNVTDPNTPAPTSVPDSQNTLPPDGEVIAGTSQYNALLLPLNTKVFGTAEKDSYSWFSFNTGDSSGDEFRITAINNTPGADSIHYSLYDEYGSLITSNGFTALEACSDGVPSTMVTNELDSNTTYYLKLITYGADPIDYSLIVKNMNNNNSAYKTAGNVIEAKGAEEITEGPVTAGTSPDNALLLPIGSKVSGTAEESTCSWFGFKTGETTGTEYTISCINTTPGADSIHYSLYDEYGSLITFNGFTALEACSDGVPSTMVTNELNPNTTYYLKLITYDANPIDYILDIQAPVKEDPKGSLVFEVPFEINETQVQFVINEATFIDEEKAKEALKPVADAILAHPDHSILLAGTTATDGTQESCVDLANRRCEAVKSTCSWFGFKTGETTGTEYTISCINTTPGADSIHYSLYDEYGSLITFNGFTALEACSDGVPSTMVTNELNPNTTYYLKLITYDANPIDYILDIQAPVKEDPKGSLVFEVPFEINETQVQFVINEATFIDEEKAKEALKPVADAILAHPDHSILLAGTTATDGTQESCVDLANRRCEAVKNLLVDTYGVPEAQLETIGLGYELDPFERGQDRDANGNFVESEGRKNRRVVVLDAEDPIAQELMKLK